MLAAMAKVSALLVSADTKGKGSRRGPALGCVSASASVWAKPVEIPDGAGISAPLTSFFRIGESLRMTELV